MSEQPTVEPSRPAEPPATKSPVTEPQVTEPPPVAEVAESAATEAPVTEPPAAEPAAASAGRHRWPLVLALVVGLVIGAGAVSLAGGRSTGSTSAPAPGAGGTTGVSADTDARTACSLYLRLPALASLLSHGIPDNGANAGINELTAAHNLATAAAYLDSRYTELSGAFDAVMQRLQYLDGTSGDARTAEANVRARCAAVGG
jgi:hypothetical protein